MNMQVGQQSYSPNYVRLVTHVRELLLHCFYSSAEEFMKKDRKLPAKKWTGFYEKKTIIRECYSCRCKGGKQCHPLVSNGMKCKCGYHHERVSKMVKEYVRVDAMHRRRTGKSPKPSTNEKFLSYQFPAGTKVNKYVEFLTELSEKSGWFKNDFCPPFFSPVRYQHAQQSQDPTVWPYCNDVAYFNACHAFLIFLAREVYYKRLTIDEPWCERWLRAFHIRIAEYRGDCIDGYSDAKLLCDRDMETYRKQIDDEIQQGVAPSLPTILGFAVIPLFP